MPTYRNPVNGDVRTVPDVLADRYDTRGWERQGDPVGLKGAALDEALDAAGLSKAGTVAEKRVRLTEHQTHVDD